jgi:hypothetical protein
MLWAKRGWASPGSQFLRAAEQLGASDAWDFVDNSYMRAGVVTTNAGLTVTRASEGYAQREDGIWVNFASGALRRTDKGALIEGARTNRALHSRDLTQAAWTATNVTVARDQVGVDGLANTACSLTATAGNGTVLQAVTDTSKARYFSVWIKRITGTGTVEVTLDNGSTWTAVTVTSAYTRVGATQTLANPTVGVRIVTSGDAVAADFAQLEDGSAASSPIATAGTAVTRAADQVGATISGYAYPMSAFAEWVKVFEAAENFPRVFGVGPILNGFSIFHRNSTNRIAAIMITSGAGQADLGTRTGALNTIQRAAARAQTDNMAISVNGLAAETDTLATMPAAPTYITVGDADTGDGRYLNGYVRKLALFSAALTNAQLQGLST